MLFLILLLSCSHAPDETQSQATETQSTLTSEEARAIAKEAYVFYYTLTG